MLLANLKKMYESDDVQAPLTRRRPRLAQTREWLLDGAEPLPPGTVCIPGTAWEPFFGVVLLGCLGLVGTLAIAAQAAAGKEFGALEIGFGLAFAGLLSLAVRRGRQRRRWLADVRAGRRRFGLIVTPTRLVLAVRPRACATIERDAVQEVLAIPVYTHDPAGSGHNVRLTSRHQEPIEIDLTSLNLASFEGEALARALRAWVAGAADVHELFGKLERAGEAPVGTTPALQGPWTVAHDAGFDRDGADFERWDGRNEENATIHCSLQPESRSVFVATGRHRPPGIIWSESTGFAVFLRGDCESHAVIRRTLGAAVLAEIVATVRSHAG